MQLTSDGHKAYLDAAIPFVLWFGNARREKRRATVELITTLATAPEVIDRLERLYKYRRHEESKGSPTPSPDPYAEWPDQLLFDTVVVLNYYESACAAIIAGLVKEQVLMESVDSMLLGMRDVVMARYSRITNVDMAQYHPNIVTLAARWEANRAGKALPRIPNPST